MVNLTAEDELQNIYENLITAFENVQMVKKAENWKDERILELEAENKKLNDWIRDEKLKKIERILKIDYNDLIDTLSSNLNRFASKFSQITPKMF
ncbi:unnamed protein product [Caenorhabditis angaria]|uniref:Uncharacterized protein n=1 Tax=Caenorhabditis angaria TaxID=860376 RepID=A0A9P1IPS7_9PELO|nr:unnamed protein product [Caenorhabditis angaria]